VFQEIRQRRLAQLRQNQVVKQVIAGREFKGQPFRATPEMVVFKVCCGVFSVVFGYAAKQLLIMEMLYILKDF